MQSAFIPHGLGLQGWITSGRLVVAEKNKFQILLQFQFQKLTCRLITAWKWVSYMSFVTNAYGYMVSNPTVSIFPTKPWTGIYTFLRPACFVCRTVWVENTFRSAIWGWSNHAREAWTVTPIPSLSWRITILATGIRVARIYFLYHGLYRWNMQFIDISSLWHTFCCCIVPCFHNIVF